MIRRLVYRKKGKEPECVSDFLARTSPTHPSFAKEMSRLRRPEIDDHALQALCQHFAAGVQYVSDHYGAAPSTIGFTDCLTSDEAPLANPHDPFALEEDGNMIAAIYDPDDQSITISRALLNGMLTNDDQAYFADDFRQEYPVTAQQYMFLLGVEEAYHHKQKFGGSKAQRKGFYTIDSRLSENASHRDDPHESEVRRIVLEVARDVGIIRHQSRRML